MNYTCPYCGHHSTITDPSFDSEWEKIGISDKLLSYGHQLGCRYFVIACPNEKCKGVKFSISLTKVEYDSYHNARQGELLQTWQLLPESTAKPQPDYIPQSIREDYIEACRIKNLSPKASATLARRCLQGMIRDFWGISKPTLKLEIEGLENLIAAETWDAIDAIRSIGNVGAHMEKDVNIIIDIEPDEADLLLKLVEDLFEEWYVARHDREERQRRLKELASSKKLKKSQKTA